MNVTTSRRGFIAGAAAGTAVLMVGIAPNGVLAAGPADTVNLTPFVKIGTDGSVTAIVKHFETGQGTATGLPTLIAEELGLRMDQISYEFAPSNPEIYNNFLFGPLQLTAQSTSMANSYAQYRAAGAAAREMLLTAAAEAWGVEAASLSIKEGIVAGAGNTAPIAEFVAAAAMLTPPAEPKLKEPSEFKLIGNESVGRTDKTGKADGTAKYAIDVFRPNQMIAMIARPNQRGALAVSFDDTAAKDVSGYIMSIVMPNQAGVIVYAENTWAAMRAREALTVEWDKSAAETRSSQDVKAEIMAALDAEEAEFNVRKTSLEETRTAMETAAQVVEKTFYFPLLAQAPMEPLNCTIEATEDGGIKLYDGAQGPSGSHFAFAEIFQLPMEKIQIETLLAGGSFGRRVSGLADYQVEAALAFVVTDRTRPIKLMWSREDDIQGGFYRPAFGHKIRAGLDDAGKIVAWEHRMAGQPIAKGVHTLEPTFVHDGVDHFSVEGAYNSAYQIPGSYLGLTDIKRATETLWWRSVGNTHNAYAIESMMDILATTAGKDPVEFRMAYLQDENGPSRTAKVLQMAADQAKWGQVAEGRSQGVAVHSSYGSHVAQVVEILGTPETGIKIEKVTCVVDCGIAVNPDVVKAQMEGGIGFGIGHNMRNEITLTDGKVDQSNFPDYEPLRIGDIGEINVHVVKSAEAPSGVGEPGVPPAAPALANAIAAAGQRVKELPMESSGVTFA